MHRKMLLELRNSMIDVREIRRITMVALFLVLLDEAAEGHLQSRACCPILIGKSAGSYFHQRLTQPATHEFSWPKFSKKLDTTPCLSFVLSARGQGILDGILESRSCPDVLLQRPMRSTSWPSPSTEGGRHLASAIHRTALIAQARNLLGLWCSRRSAAITTRETIRSSSIWQAFRCRKNGALPHTLSFQVATASWTLHAPALCRSFRLWRGFRLGRRGFCLCLCSGFPARFATSSRLCFGLRLSFGFGSGSRSETHLIILGHRFLQYKTRCLRKRTNIN